MKFYVSYVYKRYPLSPALNGTKPESFLNAIKHCRSLNCCLDKDGSSRIRFVVLNEITYKKIGELYEKNSN